MLDSITLASYSTSSFSDTEEPIFAISPFTFTLDFGNLQEMQPMTPAEIFEAKFEEEFGDEQEAFERGSQIREMQNKIMSAMYGG